MGLGQSDTFGVLTSLSLYRFQDVSGPWSVGFFRCPDNFLRLPSPVGEWASVSRILFGVLTSPSVCCLQEVSGPQLVGFFRYPDKSLCLPSPGCKWASVSRILSVS